MRRLVATLPSQPDRLLMADDLHTAVASLMAVARPEDAGPLVERLRQDVLTEADGDVIRAIDAGAVERFCGSVRVFLQLVAAADASA